MVMVILDFHDADKKMTMCRSLKLQNMQFTAVFKVHAIVQCSTLQPTRMNGLNIAQNNGEFN